MLAREPRPATMLKSDTTPARSNIRNGMGRPRLFSITLFRLDFVFLLGNS
jgi:hypothetical protein